jgi:PAS domain S-box-containing protein
MSDHVRNRFILITTASYTVLALAWIFLSDQLLSVFTDIHTLVWLSTVKGVFFVIVTAVLLLFALRAVPAAGSDSGRTMLEAIAAGVAPGSYPRWLNYGIAVALSLVALLLRGYIASLHDNRPLMILLMFPIIISSLTGGLGPGLLTTAIVVLGVDYQAIPPLYSFRIADSHDLLQWLFLIVNGCLVSVVTEMLRRTLVKVELNRYLLAAVVSGTSDAVFIKDLQGRYLLANDATAGFVGKALNEIIGHDDYALFPENTAREITAADRTIMAARNTQSHEEHIATMDGTSLVFHVTKGPVLDKSGNVVGLFGISRDITTRKQDEVEIRRLSAGFEQQVGQRTAELQEANASLEELAYALTHNLRAPIRAIDGISQVLNEDYADILDGEAQIWLAQLKDAGVTMGAMINGIITLLNCSRVQLCRESINISLMAKQRLDTLSRLNPERVVAFEVEPELTVFGDPNLMEMVLNHLIDNAWKYTGSRQTAEIRVYREETDGVSYCCVADNGAGFDMRHIDRLFKPFQRLHRQDEFPGIGIGMVTVQRIIHRHGGSINAVAELDKGAVFRFTLPERNDSEEGI